MPTARHSDASFRRPMPAAFGFTCSNMKRSSEHGLVDPTAWATHPDPEPPEHASPESTLGFDRYLNSGGRKPGRTLVVPVIDAEVVPDGRLVLMGGGQTPSC